MAEQKKLTVEDEIKSAGLSKELQDHTLDFIVFLNKNGFSIITEEDGNGWQIFYMNKCIGHMNFDREFTGHNTVVWLDTCDFGSGVLTKDALKKLAWANVRFCEHFNSGGNKCGCGRQPGFDKMIFDKEHKNLCFAHFEFVDPDTETLEGIKQLLLLYKKALMLESLVGIIPDSGQTRESVRDEKLRDKQTPTD